MLIDLFYAVLLILTGVGILKYRRVVKSWTGNFVWAERYLGNGGTYIVLIFLGLFLIFWGVLYPFGGLELMVGTPNEIMNK
ncbi:MAG: hypothetical protein PHH06_01095 [Candidatus Gracilibacteria bacterium]|nr:hypothetical protein [Candidatus Gracilibacteria bacterium]